MFGYAGSRRSPITLACLPRISESARTLELGGGGLPFPITASRIAIFRFGCCSRILATFRQGARLWDLRCLGRPDLSRLELVN